jgi:hypothetical protein
VLEEEEMRRRDLLVSCGLLVALALGAGGARAEGGGTQGSPGLRAYWERTVLGLAPWAPQVTYQASSGAVEFTGAQGRRVQATVVLPPAGQPVAGAALLLDEAAPAGPAGDGVARMYAPAVSRELPPQRALLDAYQAVSVLLSVPGVPAGKLAVEGRGEAAGLALALAALRPGEVGCVVLVEPQASARAADHWDLAAWARLVRCPALLVAERGSAAGPLLDTLAQDLAGLRYTAVVPGEASGYYWPWIAAVLARPEEPPPAAPGDEAVGYEGGLPVDLSP